MPALSEMPFSSDVSTIPPAKENNTNVYVSSLPQAVTDPSFLELVSRYGQIFSSKAVRKGPGDPPVAFVQYASPAAARGAMRHLDGQLFQGATLKAQMALRDKDNGVDCKPSANLCICNLPPACTTAELRRLFEPYGRIVSLVALTDPATGRLRGTGFVRFSSVKEARLAKEAMHGQPLRPDFPLEVKFAESNAERSQRLKNRLIPDTPSPQPSPSPAPAPCLSVGRPGGRTPPKAAAPPPASPDGGMRAYLDSSVFPLERHQNTALELANDLRHFGTPSPQDTPEHGADSFFTVGPSEASERAPYLRSGRLSPRALVIDAEAIPSLDEDDWCVRLTDSLTAGPEVGSPGLDPATPADGSSATIKVEGLPPAAQEVEVYRLCAPFGAILQVNLAPSPEGCTAFVQFRSPPEARRAAATLHGESLAGAVLGLSL